MEIASAFGKVLKRWRVARKISQAELAAKCELDRTFVSMLERGVRQPTITTLFLICKVLKVAPAVLIGQTERVSKNIQNKKKSKASSKKN